MTREVEVPHEQHVFRARVNPAKSPVLRRPGFRYVIERLWSKIPDHMARPDDWEIWRKGRVRPTREQAEEEADMWLDKAERRAADPEDYR